MAARTHVQLCVAKRILTDTPRWRYRDASRIRWCPNSSRQHVTDISKTSFKVGATICIHMLDTHKTQLRSRVPISQESGTASCVRYRTSQPSGLIRQCERRRIPEKTPPLLHRHRRRRRRRRRGSRTGWSAACPPTRTPVDRSHRENKTKCNRVVTNLAACIHPFAVSWRGARFHSSAS